jgi:uncharacterized membrane protein YccC
MMTLIAPRNPMAYDVGAFLNGALATVAGAVAAVGCSVFFLPADPAGRARRLIRTLCGEVEALSRVGPAALPSRAEWESRMYDRLSESMPDLSSEAEEMEVLDAAFAALQVGASLIDLRREAARPGVAPAWRRTVDGALDRLGGMALHARETAEAVGGAARDLLAVAHGLRAEPEGGPKLLLVRAAASLEGIALLLDDQGETFRRVRLEGGA